MNKGFGHTLLGIALTVAVILASSLGAGIVSASGLKSPLPAPHFGCIPPHSGNCLGHPDPEDNPPSISGNVVCNNPGSNGWCAGNETLILNASDPQGFEITVSGSYGGTPFSCAGPNCSIALPEGKGVISYSVLSISGLSASGISSWASDSIHPALSVTDPLAADGLNGWYVHVSPSFSLLASDATSGLASATFNNGGSVIEVVQDGVHPLTASAADNAGNVTTWNKTVRKDATPPALSFSVPYPPDGQNGWYVSQPILFLTASDGTSGLAGAEFEKGSSSLTPTDGIQTVSAIARDNAGNTTTISQILKVDTIPPTLAPSISGAGANGWYNTAVSISLNALDTVSGVGQTEYRIDGGSWQSGAQFTVSTEGEHSVEMRVTDKAGNVTTLSRAFKIDITPPHSAFSAPPEGTETRAAGLVELAGVSSDAISGLSTTEISLDGGATWQSLPHNNGTWSYAWETRKIPDGEYTLLVRADDMAGNHENTARVKVIVGNKPPKVEIQESWWLWEAGHIQVQKRQIPLGEVTMRITCLPSHPDVVLIYTGEKIPSEVRWDRHCGNGAYAAESGDYPVTLTACDTLGHCAEAVGAIKVPTIALPDPTWTPTPVIPPTEMATAAPRVFSTVQQPHPTPEKLALTPSATPVPAPHTLPEKFTALLQATFSLVGFLTVLAAASLADPRPRALRRFGKVMSEVRHGQG